MTSSAPVKQLLSWFEEGPEPVAMVRGPAGSGKTTLLRQFLEEVDPSVPVTLAAPTGRAARILQAYTGREAQTIHNVIYTLDYVDYPIPLDDEDEDDDHVPIPSFIYSLRSPNAQDERMLYVIDEASMIGDISSNNEEGWLQFGSGRLLYDLITYIFGAEKSPHKLLLVGDPYQLPPVGMSRSPALDPDYLRTHYRLDIYPVQLETIYRQEKESPILELATAIRQVLTRDLTSATLRQRIDELPIARLSSEEAPATYRELIGPHRDYERALILSPWNRTVQHWNTTVRTLLWGSHGTLQPGDRLLITRNNPYYGVFNGDFTVVEEVYADNVTLKEGNHTLTLRYVRLEHPGDCWIIDDLLYTDEPTLSPQLQGVLLKHFYRQLFGHLKALEAPLKRLLAKKATEPDAPLREAFRKSMKALYIPHAAQPSDLLSLDLRMKACQRYPDQVDKQAHYILRAFGRRVAGEAFHNNPHLNALHVRFGYAATIHKSQGGQWPAIFLHVPEYWLHRHDMDKLRSLYTGVTRAMEDLYLVVDDISMAFPEPEVIVEEYDSTPEAETVAPEIPAWKIELLQRRIRNMLPESLHLTCTKRFPYRLRYEITEGTHSATVDMVYNRETHITHTEIVASDAPPPGWSASRKPCEGCILTWSSPIPSSKTSTKP